MVDTVFIFHGSLGSPNRHWYPWMKEKLEEKGLQVFVPDFPAGEETQTLNNWLDTLEQFKENLEDSILVGHSVGATFILNVLNRWDCEIESAFLVSGFEGHLDAEDQPNVNDFSERNFDWDKIRSQCQRFCVIHSDNDPFTSVERAERLARKLGTEVVVIEGGEHFRKETGFGKFGLLLEKIEEEL